jgi:hypothetical protein
MTADFFTSSLTINLFKGLRSIEISENINSRKYCIYKKTVYLLDFSLYISTSVHLFRQNLAR